MAMIPTSDFRNGLKIEYDGQPYEIVEFQHVKPGKGGAFVRTKIKNMISGRVLDPTFKSGDKVGKPDLEEKKMQYLYKDGEAFTFMDMVSYDQIPLSAESLGEQVRFLKEETECSVLFWNGNAIGVQLPNFVILEITYCEPGLKGDTATGTTKPAELETGTSVNVPLFVENGNKIKIDTRTGAYVERA